MAPDALGHLEVWLVTGSQEMDGPGTLRQVDAHAREVAAGLGAQPDVPVRVMHREVSTSPGSIRRAALDANAADTCIGAIAWMHTFSPAKMWIAGLSALQKPLLHLQTQFNRELPWAETDMGGRRDRRARALRARRSHHRHELAARRFRPVAGGQPRAGDPALDEIDFAFAGIDQLAVDARRNAQPNRSPARPAASTRP